MSSHSLEYLTSGLTPEEFPRLKSPQGRHLPEIALAGRSNVGKSTFINSIAGQHKLAKVSSTPGKTQRIQFFLADQTFIIADLPGYGYAKAPAKDQAAWSLGVDNYLTTRSELCLLALLLDIRRTPSMEDLAIAQWSSRRSIPLFPILTKIDRVPVAQHQKLTEKILLSLALYSPLEPLFAPCPRRNIWAAFTTHLNTRCVL